jgi:hypothetical protein
MQVVPVRFVAVRVDKTVNIFIRAKPWRFATKSRRGIAGMIARHGIASVELNKVGPFCSAAFSITDMTQKATG